MPRSILKRTVGLFDSILKILVWGGLLTLLILLILKLAGFVLISEKSMPRGVYQQVSTVPQKGDMVLIQLPAEWSRFGIQRNYVRPNFDGSRERPTLKYYIAGEGDKVEISPDGIRVNGELLNYSARMEEDSKDRAMPASPKITKVLQKGEFLALSHKLTNGFDSRYYGVLSESALLSTVRPVFQID